EVDQETGTETTGHTWDGIKELDTPLPKWWLWTFYATIAWGVLYTILYPAWPLVNSATAGILGYSTRGEVHEAIAEAAEAQSVYTDRIAAMSIDAVAADAELAQFSQAGGAAIFRNNCSQCHGAGAAGVQAAGYPNLRDDAWLWGGTLDDIEYTIRHGIRYDGDDDTRYSEMPAFGDMGILTKEQIEAVADHVLSLSGGAESSEEGATLYVDNCSACHGEEGRGEPSLGAPNIADAIWLYGGTKEKIVETVTHSRAGVMPNWTDRLTDAQIKQAAIYVHSLGGGQ
ncbi:MAG: cytochrome-c oxidase, cbb3-type subunit III, partial [Pseudomonadota bacterium]